MARIRNIKPTFFEDLKLADVSIFARLLYIGLWCHMDKQGVTENSARLIKARLFPYDKKINEVTIRDAVSALVTSGRLFEFEFEDKRLILCPKFQVHQHFHNKEKPAWHFAPGFLESLGVAPDKPEANPMQTPVEPLGNRKSEIGDLKSEPSSQECDAISPEALVGKFNSICSQLPAVKKLTPKRRKVIAAALRENPKQAYWEELFFKAGASKFLSGANDKSWCANFDWILKPDNQAKIIEGNFDVRESSKQRQGLVL